MRKFLILTLLLAGGLVVSGCSVFGESGVEIAPYKVLASEEPYELRNYESLVLVSTPMNNLDEDSSPFRKLFGYISGDNEGENEISMTAPVFMDQDAGKTETMSFVLPKSFSIEDAPTPQDPAVKLEELTDYTVAAITFSGSLDEENIAEHQEKLEAWIEKQGYEVTGAAKAAGYNPPFTIPAFRRNEVLIPVETP